MGLTEGRVEIVSVRLRRLRLVIRDADFSENSEIIRRMTFGVLLVSRSCERKGIGILHPILKPLFVLLSPSQSDFL